MEEKEEVQVSGLVIVIISSILIGFSPVFIWFMEGLIKELNNSTVSDENASSEEQFTNKKKDNIPSICSVIKHNRRQNCGGKGDYCCGKFGILNNIHKCPPTACGKDTCKSTYVQINDTKKQCVWEKNKCIVGDKGCI